MEKKKTATQLKFLPLTPSRWPDLEELFGPRGACGGCWCMYWRLPRSKWVRQKGTGNKRALRRIVNAGPPPGILAYSGKQAIGWCALAPRRDYVVLANSRVLKPVDQKPVWSVTCLFIAKAFRRRGVSVALLFAAAQFAKKRGAKIVEGYPVAHSPEKFPDIFFWTGRPGMFLHAGFSEIARRSPTRPIMRKVL